MSSFKNLSVFVAALSLNAFASLETIPTGEAEAIEAVKAGIALVVKAEAQKNGHAVRDAHAKAHGCVKATFQVNENLPSHLQTTVFQPGKSFPTWIRYSNGSGKSQNDNDGDGRGMAIKLINVPGEKLADERNTQDFLMINDPSFFVRNASDYVEFNKAVASGNPLKFFFPGINPFSFRIHEMSIARRIQEHKVSNPLRSNYWTMTPYLYNDRAVKFMVRPLGTTSLVVVQKNSPNFLRQALIDSLKNGKASFDFFAQFQKDAVTMPVEDPTIEWDEQVSVPVKLATISIPQQELDSDSQQHFCENLSLNPWHSVAEHRPLGGINRTRKVVYETISELRHELNKEKLIEPTGGEEF